jgi:hypothetical protein
MLTQYGIRLEHTRDAIQLRACQYKWLVIVVSSISVVNLAAATIFQGWPAVTGWLLLPMAVAVFYAMDRRAVSKWRMAILADWASMNLDLATLCSMLTQAPGLPADTLAGMLATLPRWPADAEPVQRTASIALWHCLEAVIGFTIWFRAIAWVWAAAAIAAALRFGPAAVLGLAAIPAAIGFLHLSCRAALARADAAYEAAAIVDRTGTKEAGKQTQGDRWEALRRACFATPDIPRWLHVEHGPR